MSKNKNPRLLNRKQSFQYACGFFGLMLPLSTFNAFSYNFVIYVIGLDEFLASIGTFIGLLCFAFGGVIWGYISDNKVPGKLGRRRPFLLYGAPIFAVMFILLWLFPVKCTSPNEVNYGVAIYYWIVCAVFSTLYMMVWSPYLAMLPEISTDEENRIQISSDQGMFNMVATIIGLLLPFILISGVEDPKETLFHENIGGQVLSAQMITLSIIFAIISLTMIYITFFNIKEPIVEECKDENISESQLRPEECEPKKNGLIELFKATFTPFKNRDFTWWSGANFTVNYGMRIPMTIMLGILMYVLDLEGVALILFIILILPFVGGGFFLWNKLSKKWGLKKTYLTVISLLVIFMGSGAIFLVDFGEVLKIILGFLVITILVSCLIALYILPNPIVSKIIDLEIEHIEENEGLEDEDDRYKFSGKYFGANAFMLNLAGAISFLLIGMSLRGGGSKDPFILTILLPVTAIIMIFGVLSASGISLQKREKTNIVTLIKFLLIVIIPIILTLVVVKMLI
ncbi:MAG: MFS transporter [Candidatus Lokiarchaeota archaeon]|nr:MFS transporter [Candidatus Lokiarchaeota archaeon]